MRILGNINRYLEVSSIATEYDLGNILRLLGDILISTTILIHQIVFWTIRIVSSIPTKPRNDHSVYYRFVLALFITFPFISGCLNGATSVPAITPTITMSPVQMPPSTTPNMIIVSRGYQTTTQELLVIAKKANEGLEPYHNAVKDVLHWANLDWSYVLKSRETCHDSNKPIWDDNGGGTPILYAKALAYHLTEDIRYAEEVQTILQQIMTKVLSISDEDGQCQLNFAWGVPELVASADLIEDYWKDQTCTGPASTSYFDPKISTGNCKSLFQNWLVKNPYYIISLSAESNQNNWGAAATNAIAYISDYLWDRPEILLVHRLHGGGFVTYSPSEAFEHANQLALDRMNGYRVAFSSVSCDYLNGTQQGSNWEPVKSQITEMGIIPEDARRQESCNIPGYNGEYQNYPQVHLGNNIQQCELMLRRGDTSCFENVDMSDLPEYTYVGPDGEQKTTHLYSGRGSIEQAIKAIIVDSGTEWRHNSALEVAFRYYYIHHRLPGFDEWAVQLSGRVQDCSQDICFGMLTHGFSIGVEIPTLPSPIPSP